jgi:hypothetical protein
MKTKSCTLAILSVALATVAPAQLYLATGADTGVVSQFTISINPTLNQVTLDVDNTIAGAGGVTGTLMSFGFNAPTIAVANSGLLLSQQWTTLAVGHVEPNDWTAVHPYLLSGSDEAFEQNFGAVGGSNANGGATNQGLWFGEKATFVFQFEDFASASGFLGPDGFSARWQQVTAGSGSDKSVGDFALTPVPEPSAFGLAGVGLLALGLILRRRRQQLAPSANTSPAV